MGLNFRRQLLGISEFDFSYFVYICYPCGPLPPGADGGPRKLGGWGQTPKTEIIRGLITRQQRQLDGGSA